MAPEAAMGQQMGQDGPVRPQDPQGGKRASRTTHMAERARKAVLQIHREVAVPVHQTFVRVSEAIA